MKEMSGLSVKHDRSPVIKILVCPKSEVFCYKTLICSAQKGCKSRYIDRVHCSLLLDRFHLRTWGQCKYTFFRNITRALEHKRLILKYRFGRTILWRREIDKTVVGYGLAGGACHYGH